MITRTFIRLCANTGQQLRLVKPLGFSLDDKWLKRTGLDYHEYANLKVQENWSVLNQGYRIVQAAKAMSVG